MPKTVKGNIYCKNYNTESMEAAIKAVQNGEVKFRAAKLYGISYTTLKDQLKRSEAGVHLKLGASTHLSAAEEVELKGYVTMCHQLGYPRSWGQVRLAARDICKNNHSEHCKHYGRVPSSAWLGGFRARHPLLKTRKSEKLAKASANVTKENLMGWFRAVMSFFIEKKETDIFEDDTRVYGGDETNFQLSQGSRPVVAERGSKNVYDVTSNGHECTTVLYNFGASGIVLPPLIILKGKKDPKNIWGDDVIVMASESGWMTAAIFIRYLKHYFVPFLLKLDVKFPVVFFVDGHASHITREVVI